jgi:hypothetical protein
MNKPLSAAELDRLSVPAPTVMTKREKLMRFAAIVRASSGHFVIWHGLEHASDAALARIPLTRDGEPTAFSAAARDPILTDAGLRNTNLLAAVKFFELTKHELHAFSCDCGGEISRTSMANRIEQIATGRPPPSLFSRAFRAMRF